MTTQDDKVYCANLSTDNITIIDGATNQVLATIAAGHWPRNLCYNSHDTKVYCTQMDGTEVTVIDGWVVTIQLPQYLSALQVCIPAP